MTSDHDPIAAIATAPGRGGIGVVRVSGRNIDTLVEALLGRTELKARHAYFLPFLDADGNAIDEGIALRFEAPHSYTGEHVLELQGHGGPMVMRRLLARCLEAGKALGLRLAEPGEFTRRAFLNDRLDLAQAEAVADLIDASSEAAARSAVASMTGAFSHEVNALGDQIVGLRMLVEATLDFPEEEIEFLEKYDARRTLAGIRSELVRLLARARQGAILREGLHVVLAGRPNVGKSSLLNALAGDEVAIVTPIAGTTRDKVVQQIVIDGVALHIVDTAGLRETDDTVERLGIERTWAEIAKADVIIHLQDATAQTETLDEDIARRLPPRTPVFQVFNKVDLLTDQTFGASAWGTGAANRPSDAAYPTDNRLGMGTASEPADVPQDAEPIRLAISARTGDGLDALRQALLAVAGWNPGAESPYLARERHLQALLKAQDHLDEADAHAAQSDRVLDLFAEELRLAHDALTSITGAFTSDDLLGVIFSRFCIGK
ncbi:tRNA uridine-5-carboxymethylaminomethyl(34) synthesis GTPase MnmE [Pigmentiphaga aceris]|uniref:tRNA modification GTPase MnmE n=1 Tax=Pigmentiphaga aceris TaxID=1940612 RepID=A0A5C0B4S6_9BURK|nr:tRNA uridine-5-carboxymethylaminomethyl(34) synthesis GTPase MnmE [Pigmentiphaga aceris]QEI09024.1 tRNA uridine-5-carboxymethylaminomethyl(34) synthesis GTPase MnmE [Pigmentiphaga aceris]